ncbi:hypothetical protein F5Y18DRAFT_425977 [Xylariaceae sp. FL1019]|nr:hypothetical protein F5Y18DRAFT_425977 [Xylariaceae sp. FL1019]
MAGRRSSESLRRQQREEAFARDLARAGAIDDPRQTPLPPAVPPGAFREEAFARDLARAGAIDDPLQAPLPPAIPPGGFRAPVAAPPGLGPEPSAAPRMNVFVPGAAPGAAPLTAPVGGPVGGPPQLFMVPAQGPPIPTPPPGGIQVGTHEEIAFVSEARNVPGMAPAPAPAPAPVAPALGSRSSLRPEAPPFIPGAVTATLGNSSQFDNLVYLAASDVAFSLNSNEATQTIISHLEGNPQFRNLVQDQQANLIASYPAGNAWFDDRVVAHALADLPEFHDLVASATPPQATTASDASPGGRRSGSSPGRGLVRRVSDLSERASRRVGRGVDRVIAGLRDLNCVHPDDDGDEVDAERTPRRGRKT